MPRCSTAACMPPGGGGRVVRRRCCVGFASPPLTQAAASHDNKTAGPHRRHAPATGSSARANRAHASACRRNRCPGRGRPRRCRERGRRGMRRGQRARRRPPPASGDERTGRDRRSRHHRPRPRHSLLPKDSDRTAGLHGGRGRGRGACTRRRVVLTQRKSPVDLHDRVSYECAPTFRGVRSHADGSRRRCSSFYHRCDALTGRHVQKRGASAAGERARLSRKDYEHEPATCTEAVVHGRAAITKPRSSRYETAGNPLTGTTCLPRPHRIDSSEHAVCLGVTAGPPRRRCLLQPQPVLSARTVSVNSQ